MIYHTFKVSITLYEILYLINYQIHQRNQVIMAFFGGVSGIDIATQFFLPDNIAIPSVLQIKSTDANDEVINKITRELALLVQ